MMILSGIILPISSSFSVATFLQKYLTFLRMNCLTSQQSCKSQMDDLSVPGQGERNGEINEKEIQYICNFWYFNRIFNNVLHPYKEQKEFG